MGRRVGMIEHNDNKSFIIRYPQEKHNDYVAAVHQDITTACDDLIRSMTLFAYDKDKIIIYADPKFYDALDISIVLLKDRIRLKQFEIKYKDINDR